MQLKVSSLLFSAILMTNFSAVAQSLDKRPVGVKQYISSATGTAGTTKPLVLAPKIPDSQIPRTDLKNGTQSLKSEGGVATGGGNRLKNYDVGTERAVTMIENAK